MELFKIRPLLRKNRLPQHEVEKINKFLIGALLIHPDVSTFWNMRRELVQYGEINLDKELLLTNLVLSHKSKSNEAFAYRKWILTRLIKSINKERVNFAIALLNDEFSVCEMAARKAQNNYHAWNHRIWCIENIAKKTAVVDSPEYLNIILNQLDFSVEWIDKHVSEHSGFQYRQYLCNSILNNTVETAPYNQNYQFLIAPYVGIDIMRYKNIPYLNKLLGNKESAIRNDPEEMLKCYNYVYYFIIVLSDLFYYIRKLNEMFPGHESIWYHRRYVIYHLLKAAYDYHGMTWKRNLDLNEIYTSNFENINNNIINSDLGNVQEKYQVGDRKSYPKILKYELDKVETSFLHSCIIQDEAVFISESISGNCSDVQRDLAKRYEKWSKFVLRFNRI